MSSNLFTCPANKEKFAGECRIVRCPAHLPKGRTNSGCFHLLLHNNKHVDIPEIAFAFHISRRRTRKEILNGMQELHKLTILFNWLEEIHSEKYTACKDCGSPSCHHRWRCQQRQQINSKILIRYPFNIKPLNFTKECVWQLMQRRQRFERDGFYADVLQLSSQQLFILHKMSHDAQPKEKHHASQGTVAC